MKLASIFLLIQLVLIPSGIVMGQRQVYKTDSVGLRNKARALNESYVRRHAEAIQYALDNNIPIVQQFKDGGIMKLQYLDERGLPIYYITHNAGAAQTTGTDRLYSGGELGLDLSGNDVTVGVWDGGMVRDDHVELIEKITNFNDKLNDHATHVTGTILSTGLNAAAKGMAPNANAIVYEFSNDLFNMTNRASDSLLLSNHSYGIRAGWDFKNGSWTWTGDKNEYEDYRFGFYATKSKELDDISFKYPYYTMVWSAGNDRNDFAPDQTNHPPDGPYDCIAWEGTAKNIIVVGAVKKISGGYDGPGSVVMSDFSSWGPVDDGRIKPDIVGAGVDITSTGSEDTTSYITQSGTSMSAPNITGSLALLIELFRNQMNHPDTTLRSASMKGLVIHTANEAGLFPGPDYSYGWGLMNTMGAAEHLLNLDGQNVFLEERTLNDQEIYEKKILTKKDQKITATIVWTDPPGTPTSIQVDPTDLMLINDLDLRIYDDAGNEVKPWILDPENPGVKATKGDNFRDNVEKIEFENPEPRFYTIRVSHKGALQNGSQDFTLLLTATTEVVDQTVYYWIGNGGNWEDPTNWSLSSGGTAANSVPTISDRVVFDENSFSASGQTVKLNQSQNVFSLRWLTKQRAGMDMAGNMLKIGGSIKVYSDSLYLSSPGIFSCFSPLDKDNVIDFHGNDMSGLELVLNDTTGRWEITDSVYLDKISMLAGQLDINDTKVNVKEILINGDMEKVLDISGSTLEGLQLISNTGSNFLLISSQSIINTNYGDEATGEATQISLNNINIASQFNILGGGLEISGSGISFATINVENGFLKINEVNKITDLNLMPGSNLILESGKILQLTENMDAVGTEQSMITLKSIGPEPAYMEFNGHVKVCLDYLNIESVSILGTDAAVNAGINSIISNDSENWQVLRCEDILFADFKVSETCINSTVKFSDLSSGAITKWHWNFGLTESDTSGLRDPTFVYPEKGTYEVTLTVSNEAANSVTQNITITDNTLSKPEIVNTSQGLASSISAKSYQWFEDGEPIEGAIKRFHDPGNAGADRTFHVSISDEVCNRMSDAFIVTALNDDLDKKIKNAIKIYPNPFGEILNLELNGLDSREVRISIRDVHGRIRYLSDASIFSDSLSKQLILNNFSPGLYLLSLQFINGEVIQKKIIKK